MADPMPVGTLGFGPVLRLSVHWKRVTNGARTPRGLLTDREACVRITSGL